MHVRLQQLQQHLPHSRPASCSLQWAYGTHSSGQRQRMLLALMLMMLLLTDHLPAMPAGNAAWRRRMAQALLGNSCRQARTPSPRRPSATQLHSRRLRPAMPGAPCWPVAG